MPPQRTAGAGTDPAPAEQVLERIAAGLRVARSRTGLSENQVVALFAQQGVAISVETLRRWESSGVIQMDAATQLADAYGTTLDGLAGRRASRRNPADDLPPKPRSSW